MNETITETDIENEYSLFDKMLEEECYVKSSQLPAIVKDSETSAIEPSNASEFERQIDQIKADLDLEVKRNNEYREQVRAAHRQLFEDLE